jgi:UDP-N-acetylmuramoyl-tripeptide--D-alanyl-D-alanine ligase
MLELGNSGAELHRECGRHAAQFKKIGWIFGVQGHATDLVRAAIEAGHPKGRAHSFENSEAAGKFIAEFVSRGDLLLLKGSRGVRMEKILEAIDARHARRKAPSVPEGSVGGRKGRR